MLTLSRRRCTGVPYEERRRQAVDARGEVQHRTLARDVGQRLEDAAMRRLAKRRAPPVNT